MNFLMKMTNFSEEILSLWHEKHLDLKQNIINEILKYIKKTSIIYAVYP